MHPPFTQPSALEQEDEGVQRCIGIEMRSSSLRSAGDAWAAAAVRGISSLAHHPHATGFEHVILGAWLAISGYAHRVAI
jgi:hypothetical protein